ncbi:MAG: hypothetical protein V1767_00890 [Chloroflexota bacterium]
MQRFKMWTSQQDDTPVEKVLGRVGRVLAGGFGDQVLAGLILGLIKGVSPGELYTCIRDKIDFVSQIDDVNWARAKRITGSMDLDKITLERILEELQKSRLDLLSVIINTDGGVEWIISQLERTKDKIRN